MGESSEEISETVSPDLTQILPAAPYIAESITYICNQSIRTSHFPEKWKEAFDKLC